MRHFVRRGLWGLLALSWLGCTGSVGGLKNGDNGNGGGGGNGTGSGGTPEAAPSHASREFRRRPSSAACSTGSTTPRYATSSA